MNLIQFFLFLFAIPVVIMIFYAALIIAWLLYYRFAKKIKPIPFRGKRLKKKSVLHRLIKELPKQIAEDTIERDPNVFNYAGLHLFCGQQGSGKTIAVVELLSRIKVEFPECKIYSNATYLYADGNITHWKELIERTNGTAGCVEFIDEIQSWFSSNQSKNFPIELLGEISQQRKQRKMIVGTAQVFGRLAKPIREQTQYVYLPTTILGCLTVVRVTQPQYYNEEKDVFKKYIKWYFFVHNKDLRNSYDTYERIKKYQEQGYQSNITKFNARYDREVSNDK